MSGDRWMVAGIAWPRDRAARMDASLARVRGFLAADGVTGLGGDSPERTAARQRAVAGGMTSKEGWLVADALAADARRLKVPGARVLQRAKGVVLAAQEALESRGGLRMPPGGSLGVLERPGAVPGASEVGRYAVAEHDWQVEDRVLVVEDLPWTQDGWPGMPGLPVTWQGLVTDPMLLGGDGANWREYFWRHGAARPAWADDPAARRRVLVATRALGWNGIPLRADLDEIEHYLPWRRVARGYGEPMAWLVPGVRDVGWAFAWLVPEPKPRARV